MAARKLTASQRDKLRQALARKLNARGKKTKQQVYREVAKRFGIKPGTVRWYEATPSSNGRRTSGAGTPTGTSAEPESRLLETILRRADSHGQRAGEHDRIAGEHTRKAKKERARRDQLMKIYRKGLKRHQAHVNELKRLQGAAEKI